MHPHRVSLSSLLLYVFYYLCIVKHFVIFNCERCYINKLHLLTHLLVPVVEVPQAPYVQAPLILGTQHPPDDLIHPLISVNTTGCSQNCVWRSTTFSGTLGWLQPSLMSCWLGLEAGSPGWIPTTGAPSHLQSTWLFVSDDWLFSCCL